MRDIESDQRRSVSGGCWVYVSWTIPKNFSVYEISHFKVYLNGTQMENETLKNKAVIMKAYQVCTCDIHMLSISAVDSCGNVGESIYLYVKNPEVLPDIIGCGEPPTSTDLGLSPSSGNRGMSIVQFLYSDHVIYYSFSCPDSRLGCV